MTASADPILLLSKQRIISASAALEVEFQGVGATPTLEILHRLQLRAAESLAALATVDLFSDKGVAEARALQNEVKRYDEWLTWMRELVDEGLAADKTMKDEDREELLDYLLGSPEGRQQAVDLGLVSGEKNDA